MAGRVRALIKSVIHIIHASQKTQIAVWWGDFCLEGPKNLQELSRRAHPLFKKRSSLSLKLGCENVTHEWSPKQDRVQIYLSTNASAHFHATRKSVIPAVVSSLLESVHHNFVQRLFANTPIYLTTQRRRTVLSLRSSNIWRKTLSQFSVLPLCVIEWLPLIVVLTRCEGDSPGSTCCSGVNGTEF